MAIVNDEETNMGNQTYSEKGYDEMIEQIFLWNLFQCMIIIKVSVIWKHNSICSWNW